MGNALFVNKKDLKEAAEYEAHSSLSEGVVKQLEDGVREGFHDAFVIENENGILNLSNKGITDQNMPDLCEWIIRLGEKLKELNLSNNDITSKGSTMLTSTLRDNKSVLKILNLTDNKLDNRCIESLGEYIQGDEHLENLNIGDNDISDAGLKDLSEYIIGNTTLKEIDFVNNERITDNSIPVILDMIKKTNITHVGINDESMSKESLDQVENACLIPLDQREIPVRGFANSVARLSASFGRRSSGSSARKSTSSASSNHQQQDQQP